MGKVDLYNNKTPLRLLFFFEVIIGSILLFVFIYFFINEIYLDIWTIAGPLLGIAIFITGLTGSKIKEISLNSLNKSLVIKRESLFKTTITLIDPYKMTVELKTANGKKNSLIPKLKLIILDNGKEIGNMESEFLSLNNSKIKKLYKDLKSIVKITNTNKLGG